MSQSKRRTGFRTDTDISRGKGKHPAAPAAPAAVERELKPWVPEEEPASAGGGLEDEETFGAGAAKSAAAPGGWDQFATNARLFGATTTYDEDLYTTRLDRSGPGYKERETRAEVLAREIEQGISGNVHVMEERGHDVAGEGWDEEARYSGVKRSGGAYVPPGARDKESKDTLKAGVKPTVHAPAQVAKPATAAATQQPKPASTTAPTAKPAAPSTENMTDSLRRFAQLEREKIAQAKVDIAKTERERRLAELKAFGKSFKVPVRVGAGEGKTIERTEGKPPADKPVAKPTAAHAVKPKISMRIPEIPPFKGPSAAAAAPPPQPQPPKIDIPETADRAVPGGDAKEDKREEKKKDEAPHKPALNPAAAAFSFKPNPAASSFKPSVPVAGVKAPNGHTPSAPLKQPPIIPPQPAVVTPAQQAPPQPPRHPFFIVPPKRVPGVNVRDEFNPMKSRRATRPEETPMVWQYSGRRVLHSLHTHQQALQPSGMYALHMNGVHPVHAPGGIPLQGPPMGPAAPAQMMQPPQANATLSPARRGTTIEDERISPVPGPGPGQQPGALPPVAGAAGAGVPPGVLAYQPGGPGPAMGPGGFAPYRGPQMQHMGQPGMFAQYPGNGGVFMGNPLMQGMPYNPPMMGNGPMRPPGYYPQPGMQSHPTSPMPHAMAPHAPP